MASKGTLEIKVLGDAKGFQKTLKTTESSLGSFAKKAVGAFAALAIAKSAAGWMMGVVEAGIKERKSMDMLADALKRTAGAAKPMIAANEKWLSTMQNATAVADDEMRPVLSRLVASTKDLGKAQDIMAVSMDIAAARGLKLETVALAMQKAHDGQAAGLGRLGIAFKDAEGKTLDFSAIMEQARDTYGGAAETMANTTEGKMKRIQLALGDAKEAIGMAFIPMIESALPKVMEFAKWVGNLAESFGATAKAKGMGAAIGELIRSGIKGVADWFGKEGGKLFASAISAQVKSSFNDIIPALVEGLAKGLYTAGKGFFDEQHLKRVGNRVREQMEKNSRAGIGGGIEQALNDVLGGQASKTLVQKLDLWGKGDLITQEDVDALKQLLTAPYKDASASAASFYAVNRAGWAGAISDGQKAAAVIEELDETTQEYSATLQGLFDQRLSVASMWSEAEGSLARYLALVKTYTQGWDQFKKNLGDLVQKFPGQADLIMRAVKELGPAAPDMVAKILGGSASEQQAAIDSFSYIFGSGFDDLAAELAASSKNTGLVMGQAAAEKFKNAWGKPTVPVKVEPTKLTDAWRSVQTWFNSHPITVTTKSYGLQVNSKTGVTAEAEGGIVSRPQLSLVGEAGAEAIIPLTRPQRAAEVMQQAGLTMNTAELVSEMRALRKSYDDSVLRMAILKRTGAVA